MKAGTLFSLLLLPAHLLLWWGLIQLSPLYELPCEEWLYITVLCFPALASCILWLRILRNRTASGCLWFCLVLPLLTGFASSLIIIHTLYPAESMAGYVVLLCLFYNLLCCILLPLLRLLIKKRGKRKTPEASTT